ncbi:DUF4870 domain-containing protein [Tolypothrix campylonemoides VB511288]|nr:DUF4870 domain-containing protein [Tolypothrix campylonemoides VB511288]
MSVPPVVVSQDDRTVALLTHLSGIILGFIVPLIVWLINKDKPEKEFLVDQSKEALNFNLTLFGIYVALWILTVVTLGIAGLLTGPLMLLLWLVSLVLFIVAGVKANGGERYRYPVAVRLIK